MVIFYSSSSKNTERFVAELGLPAKRISDQPDDKFIIITPTFGDGECPKPVLKYLDRHADLCVGAIVSGNRNFGASFAGAAKVIRERYGIRTLYTFELAGTARDITICREGIKACLPSLSIPNPTVSHAA